MTTPRENKVEDIFYEAKNIQLSDRDSNKRTKEKKSWDTLGTWSLIF